MIKISYGNSRDIGNIYLSSGWMGEFYIDATPKAPDVRYISETEEKNGIDIVKSKIVQEVHTVRFMASEAMVNVMQKLPLFNNVLVTVDDLEENKVYNLRFNVSNWYSGGAYAMCDLKYAINTFVNKNTI